MIKLLKVGSNLDRNSLIAPTSGQSSSSSKILGVGCNGLCDKSSKDLTETQVSYNTLSVEKKA